jgi:hypothetical protein
MKFLLAVLLVSTISLVYGNGEGFGRELSTLDFKNIIGAPMTAVIEAQALAAKTTTDFINDVGLIDVAGKKTVRTVSFEYAKLDGNNTLKNFTLTVPFIMLLPIPYIEITVLTIDLNVKLNSLDRQESSSKLNVYGDYSVGGGWWFGSVNFKGGYSYTSESKYTGETKREYALTVHVQAGQASLPKGTERILDMLESVIRETPDVAPA